MTPTQRKAMERAISALDVLTSHSKRHRPNAIDDGISAYHELRAALAEPAPEPVRELLIQAAAMAIVLERRGTYQSASRVADAVLESARYAAPVREPAPVPLLTDQEISSEASRFWSEDGVDPIELGRAIEALVHQRAGLA